MYFLYSLGGVTFNKCWITLSILNCYSPNFQGFILMKNALNNQVGMLGDMFLWLVANLKQGGIYFIKQALPPNKSAGSVVWLKAFKFFFEVLHKISLKKFGTPKYYTSTTILLSFWFYRGQTLPLIMWFCEVHWWPHLVYWKTKI